MKKLKPSWIIGLIVFFAFLVRVVHIQTIPASLNWDEVAFGYNAFTLGVDGKDEFGVVLPFKFLESYGDFKPPLYAYLAILPIKLFGLNEFAVRFPSVLFGTLTVLITYLLVRRIFHKMQISIGGMQGSTVIALLAAFLLAISPWHIMLSRAAFEANIVTFLLTTGMWLFLESIQAQKKRITLLLSLSAISFVLTLYTFNSARVVTPLLVLMLVVTFRQWIFAHVRSVAIAAGIGMLLVIPIIPFLLSPQAGLRYKEVNIFSDVSVIERSNTFIQQDNNAVWSRFIHNRRLAYAAEYAMHYLDHFNTAFLFISGDVNPRFSTQDVGELYLADLIFLSMGIIILFRKRDGYWWILPAWLLIGIIPAATARETPHALRIGTTLPVWQILSAYGVYQALVYLKSKKARLVPVAAGVIIAAYSINFVYFFHGYLTHYMREYSQEWQYANKEAALQLKKIEGSFDNIRMTDAIGRPYAYILFYQGIRPDIFRSTAQVDRDVFGFVTVRSIGKYQFMRTMEWEKEKKILYVDEPLKVPIGATILQTIKNKNGTSALVFYTI